MRIVAEPLNYLFILNLIDQLIRRSLILRIENKHRVVTDAPVCIGDRLTLRAQFLDLCRNLSIVVAGELWCVEFNDY